MNFILYCSTYSDTIEQNLGKADYSYYFVQREFEPLLRQLGKLYYVTNPAQDVDVIYDACQARGEACVFLSFTPPHHVTIGLRCPTICVFAWEYSTIPTLVWDEDIRQDWRVVLAEHHRTITLSSNTAAAVHQAMGEQFPVLVLPTPLWERLSTARFLAKDAPAYKSQQAVLLSGIVFDSQRMGFERGAEPFNSASIGAPVAMPVPKAVYKNLELADFYSGIGKLNPFHAIEIIKPEAGHLIFGPYIAWEAGQFVVNIYAKLSHSTAVNIVCDVVCEHGQLVLAAQTLALPTLSELEQRGYLLASLPIDLSEPCVGLEIRVWVPEQTQGALYAVEITNEFIATPELLLQSAATGSHTVSHSLPNRLNYPHNEVVQLAGVVYTAVFNPADGRKNWQDMITAFCWTFNDTPDAILLLKLSQKDRSTYYDEMLTLLTQLAPFKCQVVAIDAFLDDMRYAQLIQATSYYVNTAFCEGLCIPLLEFLSCGVPAIAPNHTAMADYIDSDFAWIVESQPEVAAWSHDPHWRRVTVRYRLNWESLCQAYRDSYDLAKNAPNDYQQMRVAALQKMYTYTNSQQAYIKLVNFLTNTDPTNLTALADESSL